MCRKLQRFHRRKVQAASTFTPSGFWPSQVTYERHWETWWGWMQGKLFLRLCLFVHVEINKWLQLKNGHIPETAQCYSENSSTLAKHEKNKTKYYDTSPFAFPPHYFLVSVASRQTAWKPEECLISNHSPRWMELCVGWGAWHRPRWQQCLIKHGVTQKARLNSCCSLRLLGEGRGKH